MQGNCAGFHPRLRRDDRSRSGVTEFSPATERTFGYRRDAVVGKQLSSKIKFICATNQANSYALDEVGQAAVESGVQSSSNSSTLDKPHTEYRALETRAIGRSRCGRSDRVAECRAADERWTVRKPRPSSSGTCASGLRSACSALCGVLAPAHDDAQWAGVSAAIICQPSVGASLRKGSARMVGTAIGAVAIVVLTAFFPQSRSGFLLGLALWGAACGFVATILANNASYAAALAGFTAAIIASDLLGPTGGANGSVLILAINRAGEICIGIVCAGIVLAGTDFGGARHRLAAQFAAVAAEITKRFVGTLSLAGPEQSTTRPVRRGLAARVIALGPVIDEAIGETSGLLLSLARLRQAAVDGLFTAISGWRAVATSLERMPGEQGHHEANVILQTLPLELRSELTQGTTRQPGRPDRPAAACLPYGGASLGRASSNHAITAAHGRCDGGGTARHLARVGWNIAVSRSRPNSSASTCFSLSHPRSAARLRQCGACVHHDSPPVELFWVVATAWPEQRLGRRPSPQSALPSAFAPKEDQAYAGARTFTIGIALATILASSIEFAVLPGVQSFAGFCFAIGLVLVPLGALATHSWQRPVFVSAANVFFVAPSPRASQPDDL